MALLAVPISRASSWMMNSFKRFDSKVFFYVMEASCRILLLKQCLMHCILHDTMLSGKVADGKGRPPRVGYFNSNKRHIKEPYRWGHYDGHWRLLSPWAYSPGIGRDGARKCDW